MRKVAKVADTIELEIPLQIRFASTVRAVAAALCADLGFSIDDIDDLRLAINEALSLLADVDDADLGRLRIDLESADDVVTVRCVRRADSGSTIDNIDPLARRVLDAVVDDYHIGDGVVTLVKRVTRAA